MKRRASIRPLRSPSAEDLRDLVKTIQSTPGRIYIYREDQRREIIVSNYPLNREDQLVGVYDRWATTEMLREDLFGITDAEYMATVQWRPRGKTSFKRRAA